MRKPAALLWLLALTVVGLQAMALATRYFQPWLDGDYLLPQRFADDVIGGAYPLSGWTLSSSPYLFPDFALSLLWRAVLGISPLLPWYVVTSFLLLAILTGWTLQRVAGPSDHGWIAGALLVNGLLAWQGSADHARWLWWLGTATFHGGAVLLGLAQFALWAGPTDTAPSRQRSIVATTLLFLGLASDTLLLTQFVAPLGLALILTAGPDRWRAPRVRRFFTCLVLALVLVATLRGMLALAGWWNFPHVVRYAPTPSAVFATAGRMLADLTGPLLAQVPGFIALAFIATFAAIGLCPRLHRPDAMPSAEQRQAAWFALACIASTLTLPVLAVYWQNPQHGRYLLPLLVIPVWWLLTLLPLDRLRSPFVAGILSSLLLILAIRRLPEIHFAAWTWPYPERVAELDRFLARHQQGAGLADFWHANFLNTVSHSGVPLTQVRPDGRVQFWGNNAFHHYVADGDGGALIPPHYTLIITNDLDPEALLEKYGPPAAREDVAGYRIWLYEGDSSQALSRQVDDEVRDFLGNRPGTERIAR